MDIHRRFSKLFLISMTVGLLLASTNLTAGPLKVNSANPNAGVQGETHIVTINGVGFTQANKVRFLVNKSKTNTGGVAVTLLDVVDDETLMLDVVIPDGATVADYDIEVQLQGGRKGKGTTLFKVSSKDDRPLTMIGNTAGWYGSVTEDLKVMDENWEANNTLTELPRPCTAEWVEPDGGAGWYACTGEGEGTGGGRVIVDLTGTSWVEKDDGRNNPLNTDFCDLLNAWAAQGQLLKFGPTRYQYWFDTENWCHPGGACELRIVHRSFFAPPSRNGQGDHPYGIDLHPFHDLTDLPDGIPDLPDIGVMNFYGSGQGIVQSPVDLNLFTVSQVVEITQFNMDFVRVGSNRGPAKCETVPGSVHDAWFVTDPIVD